MGLDIFFVLVVLVLFFNLVATSPFLLTSTIKSGTLHLFVIDKVKLFASAFLINTKSIESAMVFKVIEDKYIALSVTLRLTAGDIMVPCVYISHDYKTKDNSGGTTQNIQTRTKLEKFITNCFYRE